MSHNYIPGDIVRIVKREENYIRWEGAGRMDQTLGQTGLVVYFGERISGRPMAKVYFQTPTDVGYEEIIWSYDPGCLELETDDSRISDMLRKVNFDINRVIEYGSIRN